MDEELFRYSRSVFQDAHNSVLLGELLKYKDQLVKAIEDKKKKLNQCRSDALRMWGHPPAQYCNRCMD